MKVCSSKIYTCFFSNTEYNHKGSLGWKDIMKLLDSYKGMALASNLHNLKLLLKCSNWTPLFIASSPKSKQIVGFTFGEVWLSPLRRFTPTLLPHVKFIRLTNVYVAPLARTSERYFYGSLKIVLAQCSS